MTNVEKKSSGDDLFADVCALRMGSDQWTTTCNYFMNSLFFSRSFLMEKCGNGHTDSAVFLRPACVVLAMSCEYIR